MSADPIYLDYAATTPLDPRVRAAMLACLESPPGNPAATHAAGRAARARVEAARAEVASLIAAPPAAIVFTSGATEADNLAILGAARGNAVRGRHLVSVRTEHRAVLDACGRLEREGFAVTLLTPDRQGLVDPGALRAALTPATTLVSVMLVNNETGVVQDVAALAAECRRRGALLHVDAAQAAGRIPIDVVALDVDLLSLSAHKIHGPVGIGALYVRREPRPTLVPLQFGGGQEGGLRSGTLAVHQIAGMGAAFRLAAAEGPPESARLEGLRDRLWRALEMLPGSHLNGHPVHRAPHILNVSFEGVDGEALLFALDDLALASGAACSAESGEPSYVLRALGRDDALAQASLRISLGRPTTVGEVDTAAARIRAAVERLRSLAPA
ncbi:MAG TPA: aminotransferase class V-fold PLP-dependent enzyme [Steroidobacteraceae bacterium]|nr:aminotransferase class V-fold PLP-dependent enzyme [Steroidobacteraceae bacterium]